MVFLRSLRRFGGKHELHFTVMSIEPRILVVDDSLVIQEIILDALVSEGFQVSLASTCKEAIQHLRLESPDLIFLGRMLSDAGGLELLKVLQEDDWTREIPVVFVTSPSRDEYVSEALETGAVDFLLKPFGRAAIRSKAFGILDSGVATEEFSN